MPSQDNYQSWPKTVPSPSAHKKKQKKNETAMPSNDDNDLAKRTSRSKEAKSQTSGQNRGQSQRSAIKWPLPPVHPTIQPSIYPTVHLAVRPPIPPSTANFCREKRNQNRIAKRLGRKLKHEHLA